MRALALPFSLALALPSSGQEPVDPLAALRALPPQAALERGTEIAVVDATGAPRADAIVIVADRRVATGQRSELVELRERWLADPVRAQVAVALATLPMRVALAADGTARVAVPAGGALVLALDGDTFARAEIGAAPADRARRTVLTVKPPRRIPVTITTHDGAAAAGVPVRIQVGRAAAALVTTGADGKAVLPHVGDAGEARIVVAAATMTTLQAPLAATDEPVAFQLPSCGAVTATVANLPRDANCTWVLSQRVSGEPFELPPTRTIDGGVEFAFVEPGIAAGVRLKFDRLAGHLYADLPAVTVGAVTRVQLDVAQCLHLPLRVLGADGAPAANARLRLRFAQEGYANVLQVTTDAVGAVEVFASDAYHRALVSVQRIDEQRTTSASFGLGTRKPVDHEPIEVRLQALVPLAAGRLQQAGGRPAAGVTISSSDPEALTSRTGVEGTFTILRAPPLPERIELRLSGDAWFFTPGFTTTLEVAGGSTGLALEVVAAAKLKIGIVDPPPVRDASVFVQCVEPGGQRPPFATTLPLQATELRVPEGTWNLLLHFGNPAQPALHLDRVTATSAIETHDARLLALDWRTFAAVLSLRVEDADGRPTDAAMLQLGRNDRAGRWQHGPALRGGRAELLVPKDGVHLTIEPRDPEWRTVVLPAAVGAQVVRLVRATRVALVIAPMPELPAGARLQAWFEDERGLPGRPVDVGTDGRAQLFAPGTGAQRLAMTFRHGNTGASLPDAVVTVDVGERDCEHRLEVTPAMAARLAELVRALPK